MEDIHGVDVSWLHHSKRDRVNRHHLATSPEHHHDPSLPPPQTPQTPQPHKASNGELATPPQTPPPPTVNISRPPPPQPPVTPSKTPPPKRPGLLNRGSSEKVLLHPGDANKTPPRRGSWISSISSKFSSSSPQNQPNGLNPKPTNGIASSQGQSGAGHSSPEAHSRDAKSASELPGQPMAQQSKTTGSSFFSNALRRLSSTNQASLGKAAQSGGISPRKVMNIDPNRPRCLVPDLDQNKLRRVAFCVDVEIAGGPKYKEEADPADKKRKFKEKKLKEKGEGEALKHPEQVAEEKDKAGVVQATQEVVGDENEPNPEGTAEEKKDTNRKKEKKKKSEEERKARKEDKRRRAEESGSLPIQIVQEQMGNTVVTAGSPPLINGPPTTSVPPTGRHADRPTTDPLRVYRRCCQLRETGVLKRISEQLAAPSACPVATPGTVSILDLTGSRLQLADFMTLSDWLAIVPVKKLVLEDADMTDEAIRVILAGLLAAKSCDGPRHRPHRQPNGSVERLEERSGIIEKLSLKNNPKITKEGWKHIALFIYMCKSLKGLDVSMIAFPPMAPLSPPTTPAAVESPPSKVSESPPDIAEIFSRSLAERLGGSVLEELVMGECQLTSHQIRKVTDGVTISGLKRLGLAGNSIGDEALEHIIRYVKSGMCQGLDLGGNDLRNRLGQLSKAFGEETSLWALSLADCNLEPASLKPLFPALLRLPNLRFLDLSHNHELFDTQPSIVASLRKYLPMLPIIKRIHLIDVAMSPAQAIAIAEILPECSQLAHINMLQNPQLSALAAATEEEAQEEAAALYASLMAAARVSHSLICIDIDVPSSENSEVVKALAKQVIAYCLRNLEYITQPDHPEMPGAAPGLPERKVRDIDVPEVLLHLVGQSEGHTDPHPEDAAPDNDYIVGGTGVVKALNYCLSEKAKELRRTSVPNSGTVTPIDLLAGQNLGEAKAKDMSKSLLGSAKKIRDRLRPALVRELKTGDDMAYRRLMFLDNTLRGIIQRFEDEYPDVRTDGITVARRDTDTASVESNVAPASLSASGLITDTRSVSALGDEDSDDETLPAISSRYASDVSMAAKALSIEEGQVHRLGQKMKHDLWQRHGPDASEAEADEEPEHLKVLREKLDALDAADLRDCVRRKGVEAALKHIGEKAEYFRRLQLEKPDEVRELRRMLQAKIHSGEGVEAALPPADESAIEDEEEPSGCH